MTETQSARALAAAARELARRIAEAGPPPALAVERRVGRVVCRVELSDAAAPARRPRGACRDAVMGVIRAAGRAMRRAAVASALRAEHGPGTVAKALADLTRSGELVNPRDRRGYRLPELYRRSLTPSLFDPDADEGAVRPHPPTRRGRTTHCPREELP